MAPYLPDITIFCDAAGRFSRDDLTTPIVFACLCLENRKLVNIRDGILKIMNGKIVKWTETVNHLDLAKRVFRSMVKQQLLASITTYKKTNPSWEKFWSEGERIYQVGVTNAQERIPYGKPEANLKFHLYSIEGARVWSYYLRSFHQNMAINRPNETHFQRISLVIDTDIQGQLTQSVYSGVYENFGDLKQVKNLLNLEPQFNLKFYTEEKEPILVFPDFLAGYNYSTQAYGTEQQNCWGELLRSVMPIINKYPSYAIYHQHFDFDEIYPLPSDTFNYVLPKMTRERILKKTS
jgi:hypothetical protein